MKVKRSEPLITPFHIQGQCFGISYWKSSFFPQSFDVEHYVYKLYSAFLEVDTFLKNRKNFFPQSVKTSKIPTCLFKSSTHTHLYFHTSIFFSKNFPFNVFVFTCIFVVVDFCVMEINVVCTLHAMHSTYTHT